MICNRLPGTHLAHMAQLRINQLPVSAAELRQQQSAAPIPLPALGDTHRRRARAPPNPAMERHKAAEAANDCVEILKHDPNNVPARERLARLFAEHLDQPDLGIEQVTLLLDMPDQPDARRAEWLSLIAAWQIKYRQDADAGRKTLERLLREFPQTPAGLCRPPAPSVVGRRAKRQPWANEAPAQAASPSAIPVPAGRGLPAGGPHRLRAHLLGFPSA